MISCDATSFWHTRVVPCVQSVKYPMALDWQKFLPAPTNLLYDVTLTDSIFEIGAYGVPNKSQNSTLLDQGGPSKGEIKPKSRLACRRFYLGCQKMRQGPLNTPFEVWWANIAPKLKNIWKSLWKQVFFDIFFQFWRFFEVCAFLGQY